MIGVTLLSLILLLVDDPAAPAEDAPAAKPRKSLRKGNDLKGEEATKKPSADDEAPAPESDRPIPSRGKIQCRPARSMNSWKRSWVKIWRRPKIQIKIRYRGLPRG